MRKIIILMLFILLCLFKKADNKIDLFTTSNPQAAKLLYEFVLKDMEISQEKAKEVFEYDKSDVYAIFYDLNSDGVNEIIGYIYSPYFYCLQGYELFILSKDNNLYKRISYVHFFPEGKLYILNSKTNEYHDLKLHHTKIKLKNTPKHFLETSDAFSKIKYNSKEQCYMYFSLIK